MKAANHFAFVAAIAGLGLAMSAIGAAAEDLKFALINKAHAPISEFHVSAAGHNSWEENLFPANAVLPVGNTLDIHVRDNLTSCEYDLKAVFADGAASEEYDVDLCKINGGSFTYNK